MGLVHQFLVHLCLLVVVETNDHDIENGRQSFVEVL